MISDISELVKLKHVLAELNAYKERKIVVRCINMMKEGIDCHLASNMTIVINTSVSKPKENSFGDLFKNTSLLEEDITQITRFKKILRKYGYKDNMIKSIEIEILKELHTDYHPKLCKCCDKKIYRVALSHPCNKKSSPRCCNKCNNEKKEMMFVPKWKEDDVFDLFWNQ